MADTRNGPKRNARNIGNHCGLAGKSWRVCEGNSQFAASLVTTAVMLAMVMSLSMQPSFLHHHGAVDVYSVGQRKNPPIEVCGF
jgi:hypothetical protein